jgi:VIT1/CCC1 family predicted Fe2+/Mn2+ transporter
LTVAFADAFSDALGIHISEESENRHTPGGIWGATLATFLFKFMAAVTFIVPLFLLPLSTAIMVSVVWGLSLLAFFSFYMAREQKAKPWIVVTEHLVIALIVIFITHYVGDWVSSLLG